VPKLPSLNTISRLSATELAAKPPQRPTTPPTAPAMVPVSAQKAGTLRKDSLEFPEADPWGSPALHKGHNHESSAQPKTTSGESSNGVYQSVRTPSSFTTASRDDSNGAPADATDASAPTGSGWGASYGSNPGVPASFTSPITAGVGGTGFGAPDGSGGGDGLGPNTLGRSFGGGRVTSGEVEENIIVKLLPDKEGVFMFQHHNYQVSSPRRGSKVVRRYSDFVWLLDCLQKRYPFRQLPLLPPKRVGGMSAALSIRIYAANVLQSMAIILQLMPLLSRSAEEAFLDLPMRWSGTLF
jgi:sorting nexin-8